jgi:hypothetical protein
MVERDPRSAARLQGRLRRSDADLVLSETGVPMKARVDYLKVKALVDLKSIGNQRERSIEQAIRFEIAGYHYNIQPRVYSKARKVVRELVREKGQGRASSPRTCPIRPRRRCDLGAQPWAQVGFAQGR